MFVDARREKASTVVGYRGAVQRLVVDGVLGNQSMAVEVIGRAVLHALRQMTEPLEGLVATTGLGSDSHTELLPPEGGSGVGGS